MSSISCMLISTGKTIVIIPDSLVQNRTSSNPIRDSGDVVLHFEWKWTQETPIINIFLRKKLILNDLWMTFI